MAVSVIDAISYPCWEQLRCDWMQWHEKGLDRQYRALVTRQKHQLGRLCKLSNSLSRITGNAVLSGHGAVEGNATWSNLTAGELPHQLSVSPFLASWGLYLHPKSWLLLRPFTKCVKALDCILAART